MLFSKPKEVLGALVHAYYEDRNIDAVLSCVTDDLGKPIDPKDLYETIAKMLSDI